MRPAPRDHGDAARGWLRDRLSRPLPPAPRARPQQHVGRRRGLRARAQPMSGSLALVGGGEWQKGCDFDRDLLAEAGTDEVLVLPTAAAYEEPQAAVDTATG